MKGEESNQPSSVLPAYLSGSRENDMSKTRQRPFALYALVMVGMLIFNVVGHFLHWFVI